MYEQPHIHKEVYRCLGEVISERRKRLGLSQQELAQSSGVDRSFLSGVENGSRKASFGTVARISGGLKMKYARLVNNCEQCVLKGSAS